MQSKFSTIVIDDIPECINDMLSVLKSDNRFEVVATAQNGADGAEAIRKHNPDLVLTDIEMPLMNGFDMVIGLKEMLNITPTIIFITGYDKYAIQAVKCSAFDYIVKTNIESELQIALNRFALSRKSTKENKLNSQINSLELSLKKNKQIIITSNIVDSFINPMEIVYITTLKNNANSIFMKNGEYIATNQTLNHFENILSTSDFFRLNKSCIINVNFIKEIKKESVLFRKKYVYMKYTDTDVNFQIPSGKYTKLIKFVTRGGSIDSFS